MSKYRKDLENLVIDVDVDQEGEMMNYTLGNKLRGDDVELIGDFVSELLAKEREKAIMDTVYSDDFIPKIEEVKREEREKVVEEMIELVDSMEFADEQIKKDEDLRLVGGQMKGFIIGVLRGKYLNKKGVEDDIK